MRLVGLVALALTIAGCTAVSAPGSTRATLRVDGSVRGSCGAIGGCAYFAELTSAEGTWTAEFDSGGGGGAIVVAAGLPRTLPAGEHRITLNSRYVSDVISNGERTLGPVDATCSEAFTVEPGHTLIGIRGTFVRARCALFVDAD